MSSVADLQKRAREHPAGIAMRHKKRGVWVETTWATYAEQVARVAGGLRALGVGEGTRVGILGHNRPAWPIAELAAHGLGAVPVGLDATTETVTATEPLAVLVVDDEEQLDKALEAGVGERLVVVEERGVRALGSDGRLVGWSELTGAEPVELRDGGDGAEDGLPVREGDQILSYLPMHTAPEHELSVAGAVRHGMTVHFGEGVFKQDLRDVQPTVLAGPPALWERTHAEVTKRMADASWLKRRCYAAALGNPSTGDLLALRALREKLGLSRARLLVSTGPVEPGTRTWFEQIGRPLEAPG